MMVPAPDLHALLIRLTAGGRASLRATQGHLAHAAFLDILRQVDGATAAALHDYNGRKPFTLSPLSGFGHARDGVLLVQAGQEGWLRVTLLDPRLFRTFIGYFLQGGRPPAIRLGRHAFHLTEILGAPGSHALAGCDSLAGLQARWEAADAAEQSLRTLDLLFASPTAFSQRGGRFRRMSVLPEPALVFGELARYWDALAGSDHRPAVLAFVEEAVVVARHRLETHMYDFPKGMQVGFSGRVAYTILDDSDPFMLRHLNCLADLAFYTGVGYKTTMGMGQARRIMN